MAYHPPSALSERVDCNRDSLRPPTLIDFLKRYSNTSESANPVNYVTLGDDILENISDPSISHPDGPFTQILFLSSIRNDEGCTTNRLRVTPATLERICFKLNIPLAFLEAVFSQNIWSNQSGSSFHRSRDGRLESIDGFYHYFHEWDLGCLHVWFSYNIITGSITYVLIDCPEQVKSSILANINEAARHVLHQPFEIDLLIAEQCASWREEFINKHYKQIFDWQDESGRMNPPLRPGIEDVKSLQDLHQLSRAWNMIFEDLGDLAERLSFHIATAEKLAASSFPYALHSHPSGLQTPPPSQLNPNPTSTSLAPGPPTFNPAHSAVEAFQSLLTRTTLRRRWVTSFSSRTNLIINFIFGITNIRTSNLTSQIATETQRDNSSMITIATLTMIFLPATAISSIFSMVFFYNKTDENGNSTGIFAVSSELWLFFVVTVPVTDLVMVVYMIWRRKREARLKADVRLFDPERGEGSQIAVAEREGQLLDLEMGIDNREGGVGNGNVVELRSVRSLASATQYEDGGLDGNGLVIVTR